MSRRWRKKDEVPGVVNLTAEVILGLTMGALVAIVWLALAPVIVVKGSSKIATSDKSALKVVYVSGSEGPVRPSVWKRKHQAFLDQDPNGIELREEDVNIWLAKEFDNSVVKEKWQEGKVEVRGALPRFRFTGDKATVGVMGRFKFFNLFDRKFIVQAAGDFARKGNRFDFVCSKMSVGALPIPFSAVRNEVSKWLLTPYAVSEAFLESWKTVDDVKIQDGTMRIGFRTPVALVAESSAESEDETENKSPALPAAVVDSASDELSAPASEVISTPTEEVNTEPAELVETPDVGAADPVPVPEPGS